MNSSSLFLVLVIVLSLITPSLEVSCDLCDTMTYRETEPGLQIKSTLNFKTETVVQLARFINESDDSDLCIYKNIELRWIHRDGTIEANRVDFQIHDINFCPGPNGLYPFDLYRSLPDLILVIHVNSTDSSYYGLLVDKSGRFISNSYLGPVPLINGKLYPNFRLTPYFKSNEESNFIFTNYETERSVMWRNLIIDDNKKINPISSGKINLKNPFDEYFIYSELNENFAFVNISKQDSSNIPYQKTVEASITYIKPATNETVGPYTLYQSTVPGLDINTMRCNTHRSRNYFCILSIIDSQNSVYLIKVSFIYPSNVISINEYFDARGYNHTTLFLNKLLYGDFLIEVNLYDELTGLSKLTGLRIDDNGNLRGSWDFPNNLTVSPNYGFVEYQNGTVSLVINEVDKFSWKIMSSTLEDPIIYDYGIPEIMNTYPTIDSEIPISTNVINITYDIPVAFSNHNISIYQNITGMSFLRQRISKNLFENITYSNDSKTISLDILRSTFNRQNTDYYIIVDDDAIKNTNNGQPLLGVEKGYWNFRTGSEETKYFEDAEGLFVLTHEGFMHYRDIGNEGRSKFHSQLTLDLAQVLSIDPDRLDQVQLHNINYDLQVTLLLPIKSTTNKFERNVGDLAKDLDALIRNRNITMISWLNTTSYIDSRFGFKLRFNLFKAYWKQLIGMLGFSIVLTAIYLLARNKNPQGDSYVVYKIALIISDVVLDIIFIIQNASKFEDLFWPSIIFKFLPMTINIGFGAVILMFEMGENNQFRVHMMSNRIIAATFTILAITDVEALHILSSKFAGLNCFNAPHLTTKAQKFIYWLSFTKLFLEDVPQTIIQIIYQRKVSEFDIIPLLTSFISITSLSFGTARKIFGYIEDDNYRPLEQDDDNYTEMLITDESNNVSTLITVQKGLHGPAEALRPGVRNRAVGSRS